MCKIMFFYYLKKIYKGDIITNNKFKYNLIYSRNNSRVVF